VKQLILEKKLVEGAVEELRSRNSLLEQQLQAAQQRVEQLEKSANLTQDAGPPAADAEFCWKRRALELQDQLRLHSYAAQVSNREELSQAHQQLGEMRDQLEKRDAEYSEMRRQLEQEREMRRSDQAEAELRLSALETSCTSLKVGLEHRDKEIHAADARMMHVLRSKEALQVQCDAQRSRLQMCERELVAARNTVSHSTQGPTTATLPVAELEAA